MTFKDLMRVGPQYLLPHHALSGLMSKLTHAENQTWKNLFIRQIIKHYGVNMQEAAIDDINAYKSFNDFFTRALTTGIRPMAAEADAVACPADGEVSQAGEITTGRIVQAKGKSFTIAELLGGDRKGAAVFANGRFATIYLSPKDYHRLHMPLAGRLTKMVHIPGRLFSVNNATTAAVPGLFARNERIAAFFDTEAGPMVLVLVGAIFVYSIETVWHGVVTPPTLARIRTWHYGEDGPLLEKGEEMGRFNMGSTIIVLFSEDNVEWNEGFQAGTAVRLGQAIGRISNPDAPV
jgi:phosphatidylserine decarboxylase